ncbi:MAG: hypothetical protein QGH76_07510 [Phycisphaerales bacterium]|jgi:hypothetical protein|nr:hypothetical protein [Phycisphaerales bacterium]
MNRHLDHAAACSLVLAAMIWTGFDGSCGPGLRRLVKNTPAQQMLIP